MKETDKDKVLPPDPTQTATNYTEPEMTLEDLDSISPTANDISAEGENQTPHRVHPNFEAARVKTQFKPGQSGNPGGRRKPIMRDMLLKLGLSEHARDPKGRTYLELASNAVILTAIDGSVTAFREVCDRIDGKCAPARPFSSSADRLEELVKALQEPDEEKFRRCRQCHRRKDEDDPQ